MTAGGSGEIVVVFVTRRSSGIGRRMESVLARLQVRERSRVKILRIDADRRPEVVRKLAVKEIPSILVYKNRKPVAWLRGRATLGDVDRALARAERHSAHGA
jgi:thioredoxin-like negative regulator of GroEL